MHCQQQHEDQQERKSRQSQSPTDGAHDDVDDISCPPVDYFDHDDPARTFSFSSADIHRNHAKVVQLGRELAQRYPWNDSVPWKDAKRIVFLTGPSRQLLADGKRNGPFGRSGDFDFPSGKVQWTATRTGGVFSFESKSTGKMQMHANTSLWSTKTLEDRQLEHVRNCIKDSESWMVVKEEGRVSGGLLDEVSAKMLEEFQPMDQETQQEEEANASNDEQHRDRLQEQPKHKTFYVRCNDYFGRSVKIFRDPSGDHAGQCSACTELQRVSRSRGVYCRAYSRLNELLGTSDRVRHGPKRGGVGTRGVGGEGEEDLRRKW